jgi:hypothetical protein
MSGTKLSQMQSKVQGFATDGDADRERVEQLGDGLKDAAGDPGGHRPSGQNSPVDD